MNVQHDKYMLLSLPLNAVVKINVDENDNIFQLVSDLHSSMRVTQFCNSHMMFCKDINLLLFVTWLDTQICRVYPDATVTNIVSLIHCVIRNSTFRRAAVTTFHRRWDKYICRKIA